jgi:hypothetical protein
VQHTPSTTQSGLQARARDDAATDGQPALMRGLIHGVILSMIVWMAAGYLTLVLR